MTLFRFESYNKELFSFFQYSYYKGNVFKIEIGLDELDYNMTGPLYTGATSDVYMLATSGILFDLYHKRQQREFVCDKAFRLHRLINELDCTISHAPIKVAKNQDKKKKKLTQTNIA